MSFHQLTQSRTNKCSPSQGNCWPGSGMVRTYASMVVHARVSAHTVLDRVQLVNYSAIKQGRGNHPSAAVYTFDFPVKENTSRLK